MLKKTDESEEKKRLGSSINEEVPEKKTGESTDKESYGANINEEVTQNVETEKSVAEERTVDEQEGQDNENDQSTSKVEDSSKTLKRKREQIVINSCFEKIGKKGRKKVRCKVCKDNPDVVQSHKKQAGTLFLYPSGGRNKESLYGYPYRVRIAFGSR